MKKIILCFLLSAGLFIYKCEAQTWSSAGADIGFVAQCFAEYNGELYAGAKYVKGYHCIFKLNGDKWEVVGNGGILPAFAEVKALVVYNDELYAGGVFETAGGKPVKGIARWDGKTWKDVGGGVDGYIKTVTSLAVYKDELYVGGAFKTTGGQTTYNIARWNGKKWSPVGSGLNAGPTAMFVYKDELYAGGPFSYTAAPTVKQATQVSNLAKWNGTTWSAVGEQGKISPGSIGSFALYKDELYVDWFNGKINGKTDNSVSKWNGEEWTTAGTGITGSFRLVNALAVYKDELYVGGNFYTAGGKSAKFLAKWNGSEWSAVDDVINDEIKALYVFNDELYVSGIFRKAGKEEFKFMAKYKN